MAQGFISEEAAVASISTPAALARVITLSGRAAAVARDPLAVSSPAGGYFSHLDLVVLATAGTPTGCSIVLTYDAAGDEVFAVIPATDVTLVPALTTASTYLATAKLDKWCRLPTGGVAGIVYAFLAMTGGATVTLQTMRLHWRDGHSGG
jgi:hypothetical protein